MYNVNLFLDPAFPKPVALPLVFSDLSNIFRN